MLRSEPMMGVSIGLIEWLTGGIFNGLFLELIEGTETEIKPVEAVVWSWRGARQVLGKGLLVGLLVMLFFGLVYTLFSESVVGLSDRMIMGLAFGLPFGLFVVPFFGLFSGLSSGILDEHKRMAPNQGIWRSAHNSMHVGLIGGLIVGSLFGLSTWFLDWLFYGLTAELTYGLVVTGLSYGLIVGTAFGLRGGGLACIKHLVLRMLLWRTRSLPWNYPRFLDYAAECILLRKVGGGYIFLHRLLLNYFADLETGSVSGEMAEGSHDILPLCATACTLGEPTEVDESLKPLTDSLTPQLAPVIAEGSPRLPCGHEWRPNARICDVCGTPVAS